MFEEIWSPRHERNCFYPKILRKMVETGLNSSFCYICDVKILIIL